MRCLTEDGHAGIDVRATSNCTRDCHLRHANTRCVGSEGPPDSRGRVHCAKTIWSPMKQCGVLYEEFREPCSLRGTCGICMIKVHRACYGVVGFTMNDGTKDCEVLSNGKWPQRAQAMKSKDGHPTSSGKPKCTTSQSAQLKAPCPPDRRSSW